MNFIRTLLNCCAGFQFYRNVVPLHPLDSIKFLAGVILLVVIVQIGTFIPVLRANIDKGADWVQTNLPRFEIKNGEVLYDSTEPFVYDDKTLRIAIDTTGATNSFVYSAPYTLFVGRDRIRFGVALKDPDGRYVPTTENVPPLKSFPNGIVNGEYVRTLATKWLWLSMPYAVLLYFFGWLLGMLIQAYVFTLAISFAESTTLRKFGFNELFNVAAHACAPAAIVVTTLIVSRAYHQFEWVLIAFLVTYFVYVMGATAACRREEGEEKDEDESM
jgi:hypothetical protein